MRDLVSESIILQKPIRILVVDDFEPLRRLVCSVLKERAEFQVIGQAVDGIHAIQKAVELQPDLILLDIGLPKLNGIAAARQIRKLAPKSKILFLTQDTDTEIVKAALSTGANGYLIKSDLGNEIFEALEAVSQDTRFVSSRLAGGLFADINDTRGRGHFRREGLAPTLPRERETHVHKVHFYSDQARFLDTFNEFIAAVLKAGNVVIVVATESHRNNLFSKLQAGGLDVRSATEQGNYIALDVAETLSTFMINDLPDPVRFSKAVDDLMARAAKAAKGEYIRVAACGECAPVLWAQGKAEAAVRVEQLWDGIAKNYDVDILCGYPLIDFLGEERRDMFQRICEEHTAVLSP
jgi:DNA-binding NarL/FixJ family response regulator